MSSDSQDGLEVVRQQIRDAFARRCVQGYPAARAIELVAIDLQLSLEDCRKTVGRDDLSAELGTPWMLEFPDIGPPAMRRHR